MKRSIALLLFVVTALGLWNAAMAEQLGLSDLPGSVQRLVRQQYPDHQVSSISGFGNEDMGQFALVLSKAEQRLFLIIEKARDEAGYAITVENSKAIKPGTRASALIDTAGDAVFLSFQDERYYWQFNASKGQDGWGDVSLILWEKGPESPVHSWYYHLQDGLMHASEEWSDGNDNTLSSAHCPPFPVPLMAGKTSLSSYDWSLFPTSAQRYFLEDSEALQATIRALRPAGWQHEQAALLQQGIVLQGKDRDGQRRLYISNWVEPWQDGRMRPDGFTLSAPLPDDAHLHAGSDDKELNILMAVEGLICTFHRNGAGRWVLGSVTGEDWFHVGVNHVIGSSADSSLDIRFGDLPAFDLETMELDRIPKRFTDAVRLLDQRHWAVVSNPNPADRLHLRQRPDRQAASLGKYYSGTPIRVLARRGDWAKVDLFGTEGWMLAKYLVFGDGMNEVKRAMPQLSGITGELRPLYQKPQEQAMELQRMGLQHSRYLILGVVGDAWYHVWFPTENIAGYMKQAWFWEGNG